MKSMIYNSFLSFFLLLLSSSLPARSREDFLKLYQESTTPAKEKRKKSAPITPLALKESVEMGTYLFTVTPQKVENKDLFWRSYYQGQKVFHKEGIFQFTAEKGRDNFDIIIAMIKAPMQTAVTNMEVPNGIEFIHYQLNRIKLLSNSKKYRWKIKESKGNQGLTLPEDALIILIDPNYVKKIVSPTWERGTDIIMLPTIILANNNSLHEASIKTVLAALDTDGFHSHPEIETTKTDGVYISRSKYS